VSLVQDLADRLRCTRDDLPVAEVSGAAERLRTAAGLLAWVMHQSSRPQTAPSLGSATSHLDHAAAALRVAQDAIDEYRSALGLPAGEVYPDHRLPALPAQVQRANGADTQLTDWWSKRIAELSGLDIDAPWHGPDTSAELLQLCANAALDGDRPALHRHLVSAGPAVGLGLAAIAPPLLRHLATQYTGHPPRLEDLARVRRGALPLLAGVLPRLTPDPAEEIIARVCHAQPQRQASQPAHPADVAVASALLVAALLRSTGRAANELAQVVEQQREAAGAAGARAAERAKSHRAELRITDNVRRRSAVDELRPAN
jgi:hypothetical protein